MIKDVMGNQRTDSTQGTSGAPVPDANDIPVEQRRLAFARETPFDDPSLAGLFALLREVLDKNTRIELSRFARERLRSAFPAGSGKTGDVKLANGLRVAVDLGDSFGAEFLIGHLNESDLLDAVTANIPEDAKIVDVGANFGLYALHAAWAAGPGAQVVAFEPLPSAAGLLQRNVEANGLSGQINCVASAVGARRGKSSFFVAEDGAFSGLHDTKRSRLAETIEVPVVSLDGSPEVAKLGAIDFLKVDVEGHEGAVLSGARKLLEKSPSLLAILEVSHKNLTASGRAQIISALQGCAEAGFRIWLHDGDGVRVCDDVADDLAGEISATLILAAEGCDWAAGVISALEATARNRGRSEIANGLQPLLLAVRDARHVTSQAETLSARFASGASADQALQEVGQLLAEQQAQIRNLTARIGALDAHSAELQSKLDERLASYHALAAQRTEQEAAYKAILEQRAADLASTRQRAERLAGQVEAFREQAQTQQANAKSALEKASEKLATSREREAALAEKIEAFRAQLEAQQVNAKSALEKTNEKLAASREREASLRSQMEAFRKFSDAQQEKLDARTQIMEAAIAARDSHEQEARRALGEVKAAESRIAQLENQCRQREAEAETHLERIMQLTSSKAAISAELDRSHEAVSNLESIVSNRNSALELISQQLEEKVKNISDLERQLAGRNAEIVSLHAEVTELTTTMSVQMQELETQRTTIRQLQQREALLKLGKLKG